MSKNIITNICLLALGICQPSFSFAERLAAHFVSGVPAIMAIGCSASAVQSPLEANNAFLFTAAHCNVGVGKITSGLAFAAGNILGVQPSVDYAFRIPFSSAEVRPELDLIVAKVPTTEVKEGAKLLQMAEDYPKAGAHIKIAGYPTGGLPFLATANYYSEKECIYRGAYIAASPISSGKGAVGIYHVAECAVMYMPSGFSGGPVLNEKEEFFGVMSNVEVHQVTHNFPVPKTYVIFAGITKNEIAKNLESAPVRSEKILPDWNGQRLYSAAVYLKRDRAPKGPTPFTFVDTEEGINEAHFEKISLIVNWSNNRLLNGFNFYDPKTGEYYYDLIVRK